MTSKEFFSRKASFSILDEAAELFINGSVIVYHVVIFSIFDKVKIEHYVSDTSHFGDFKSSKLSYAVFEEFSYASFKIQLRYFKGYLARLSSYQLDVLRSSDCCKHLFMFIDKDDN